MTTTSTTVPRPVVGGLGDSLMAQVGDALPAALPEADVGVEAVIGLTASDAIPATERLLARGPVAVVVSLGTNDARDGATAGDDLAAVKRVAERLSGVPCVRWTTVNEFSRFPAMNAEAHAINDELRRIAATRKGFAIIPWAAAVRQHPSYLSDDGLHDSIEGQAVLTRRLAAALRGCLTALQSGSASRIGTTPG